MRVAVELLGVHKIRFTGGEPLLRPGLAGSSPARPALRTDEGGRPSWR